MNDNLSFIIDYLYQKHIENNSLYINCIYDKEQLKRKIYLFDSEIISRFKLDNRYSYNHVPYSLSKTIIKKLSLFIEISDNDFINNDYYSNIFDIKINDRRIIYYDQNKLLLNNSFNDDIFVEKTKKRETTTFDILNKIRKFQHDKRC